MGPALPGPPQAQAEGQAQEQAQEHAQAEESHLPGSSRSQMALPYYYRDAA